MDKLEKIARSMFQLVFLVDDKRIGQHWENLQPSVRRQWIDKAESLIEVFEELGYRKPKDRPELEGSLNITEATKEACKEPTLLEALVWICVWESERIVKQARVNPQWETCFKVCLQSVLDSYQQKRLDRPELREKIAERCYYAGHPLGSYDGTSLKNKTIARAFADQILALIPDELPKEKPRFSAGSGGDS